MLVLTLMRWSTKKKEYNGATNRRRGAVGGCMIGSRKSIPTPRETKFRAVRKGKQFLRPDWRLCREMTTRLRRAPRTPTLTIILTLSPPDLSDTRVTFTGTDTWRIAKPTRN